MLYKEREKNFRCVTIKPRLRFLTPSGDFATSDTLELWRDVRYSRCVQSVKITLHSKCTEGHTVVEDTVLPGDATLGQIFDWLYEGQAVLECETPTMVALDRHEIQCMRQRTVLRWTTYLLLMIT